MVNEIEVQTNSSNRIILKNLTEVPSELKVILNELDNLWEDNIFIVEDNGLRSVINTTINVHFWVDCDGDIVCFNNRGDNPILGHHDISAQSAYAKTCRRVIQLPFKP